MDPREITKLLDFIRQMPASPESDELTATVFRLAADSAALKVLQSQTINNVNVGNVPLQNPLIEEVKQMMLELKIKGSLRERRNGLLELRTVQFGSVYGRSEEEIREKVIQKLHFI